MTIGILCCQVMEREVRSLIRYAPNEFQIEILEWGLHIHPPLLLSRLVERIRAFEDHVTAVVLAFGRCQTLDKLPDDFKIPVLYPPGEDCIGVLLGQERYLEELYREAGTWFLPPGWAELGMTFIFSEIQAGGLAKRNIDPMTVARKMLKGYKRALLIDTGVGDIGLQREQAQKIADLFGWRVEITKGSLIALENVLKKALALSQPTIPAGEV
jgi:hypothetical protein